MKLCPQTETQSVYQHGISVRDYLRDLIRYLRGEEYKFQWKFPQWLKLYSVDLLACLPDDKTLENYTVFHDCGKPFCHEVDEQGRTHFPNHSQVSADIWSTVGGTREEVELMRRDMEIHQLKAANIQDFVVEKNLAAALLLTGLSEVHSNAIMFGGIDSISFKIKWNQIDRRGLTICKLLFGEKDGSNALGFKSN